MIRSISLMVLMCFLHALPAVLPAQDTLRIEWQPVSGGFHQITELDVTRSGALFVLEPLRNRLIRLNSEGKRTDSLGVRGSGQSSFDRPSYIDATNGLRIYIADRYNNRVQVFDRHLAYITTLQVSDQAGRRREYRPTLVAENQYGEVFVWDELTGRLLKFDGTGNTDLTFNYRLPEPGIQPAALAVAGDEVFLADTNRHVVYRLNRFGSPLGFTGGFGNLQSMSSDGTSLIILSDHGVYLTDTRMRTISVVKNPQGKTTGVAKRGNTIWLMVNGALHKGIIPD